MSYNRVIVSEIGNSDVLKIIKDDKIDPKPNEVQLKVLAAGVAPGDIFRRKTPSIHAGLNPPFTIGYDVAGEVVSIGSEVKTLKIGQKVAGFAIVTQEYPDPKMGGYSEFVNIPEHRLVSYPDNLDPEKVVSVVLNYITAYYSLYKYADPKPKETMLVHGGAGGVGSAVLELGKLKNLKMYATASKTKHDVLLNLGVIPIDYKTENFEEVINKETNYSGIDIVMDSVSGDYTDRSYNLLKEGGRYVAFGWQKLNDGSDDDFMAHLKKTDDYNNLNNSKKTYAYYGMEIDSTEKDLYRTYLTDLINLLAEGKLNPLVKRMKLSQAAEAHELIEKTAIVGKIVLIPDIYF
jgi:NADPH:quinone reductase-like Zn-dependent oxidoreductase